MYVQNYQTTWDVHFSAIASALRNSTHATIEQSPYFAVFGQHMVQHAGSYAIFRDLRALGTGKIEIVTCADHQEATYKQIIEKQQLAHDRNVKTYDTRSRNVTFEPRQEVSLRNFMQSDFANNYNAKLGRQWTPARIVSRKGSSLYVVEDRK